jgi:hypothetical protein
VCSEGVPRSDYFSTLGSGPTHPGTDVNLEITHSFRLGQHALDIALRVREVTEVGWLD